MTTFTIKSRKHDKTFNFWMNGEQGYIHLESKGRPGQLGRQICKGGEFGGSTLYADSEDEFLRKCREWYRNHKKKYLDE